MPGEISTPGEIAAIATNYQYAIIVTRLKGARETKTLDLRAIVLFRFANGKILEQRSVPFDGYQWDQFWA